MFGRKAIYGSLVAFAAVLSASQLADACTRILWNNNKLAVLAGRTMDWPESTEPIITMLPRGMSRDGGRIGGAVAVADNPASPTAPVTKRRRVTSGFAAGMIGRWRFAFTVKSISD